MGDCTGDSIFPVAVNGHAGSPDKSPSTANENIHTKVFCQISCSSKFHEID